MADSATKHSRLLFALTVFFLLLPPANYLVRAQLQHAPLSAFARVADWRDPLGLFALAFPLAVGLGLALARAWGFWLFMLYAPVLIAFNVRSYLERPYLFNAGALVQSALALALVAWFMQRDVYKPLLAPTRRGFRKQQRWRLNVEIIVDGATRTTRDFGENSCYVFWPDAGAAGRVVKLELTLGGRRFALDGMIARVDEGGAGIQFRAGDDAKTLRDAIRASAPREKPDLRNLAVVGAILLAGAGAGALAQRSHPYRARVIPPPSGPTPCEIAFRRLGSPLDMQTFSNRCTALTDEQQRCLEPPRNTAPECASVIDRLMRR